MKASEHLEKRVSDWRELETLCRSLETRLIRRISSESACRLSRLYRSACADLALADAYQLPPGVIAYLHQLVGRAHNQLYRSRSFQIKRWLQEMFFTTPGRLRRNRYFHASSALFWGLALVTFLMVYQRPNYAETILGSGMVDRLTEDFSKSVERKTEEGGEAGSVMVGFYIRHNTSLGLQCFAMGLLFGVGGLFSLTFNAILMGAIFGYMARSPCASNFFTFVAAHGPFELTAITLAGAAGMQVGFALINTGGYRRGVAMRLAAIEAAPTLSVSVLFFIFAAFIEAFLSPSTAPFSVKLAVSAATTILIITYVAILGRREKVFPETSILP